MKIDPEEFKRYTNNESSATEKAKIEEWLNQEEEDLPEADGESHQLTAVWNKLSEITVQNPETTVSTISGRSRRLVLLSKIAACTALFLGLAWLVRDHIIANEEVSPIPMRLVETRPGQQMNVNLPDGTKIVLNADSKLEFPEHFEDSIRLVRLTGEAFFDVAHDATKPFVIHTDSSYTQVLGTSFNLNAYSGAADAVLTVKRGKVLFGRFDSKQQLILTVGMQGKLTYNKGVSETHATLGEEDVWTDNTLAFSNEPLADVAKKIERWYGVSVNIQSNSLKSLTVTGRYKGMNLEKVLNSLAFSTGLTYEVKNKVVTIREQ